MICAALFDLDGTLVQTEELKARSYADAARELNPTIDAAAVVGAFDRLAGRSRQEVAETLVTRFHLPGTWEEYVALRLRRYDAMLADAALIRHQALPAALALLHRLRREGRRTGLTTMSDRAHAGSILTALGLLNLFDAIVTASDVAEGKPSPEMYVEVCRRLRCAPSECVALEDSVAGVSAAVAAGVRCVAVPTYLTRDAVHGAGLVGPAYIVDDPARLEEVFDARAADR